jgi:hypothetical protein
MWKRALLAAALVLFLPCASRGTEYQFTLQGVVTYVDPLAYPSINRNDPFTMQYRADTVDEDPSNTRGAYDASPVTLTFPHHGFYWQGFSQYVSVTLALQGRDLVQFSAPGANYWVNADFEFPAGTLTSDALPLSLPLTAATTALLDNYDDGPVLGGVITSYSSVAVPEPAIGIVASIVSLAALRRGPAT